MLSGLGETIPEYNGNTAHCRTVFSLMQWECIANGSGIMADHSETTVNIIGAGLAGLSAAIHLAMEGIPSRLISAQPSERAQSVLAEGGINGALNTMGEDDRPENHFADTMKAGCDIADPAAVKDLTDHAPGVIRWLDSLGVPFQRKGEVIQQRNFGGQKKKRTAYAQSSIGKVLMTALIDEARKYEAAGTITRYARHDFVRLILKDFPADAAVTHAERRNDGTDAGFPAAEGKGRDESEDERRVWNRICTGVVIHDHITDEILILNGPVLMACGGLSGLFPGRTTGTTANTGDAAAVLFSQGVVFSNLEMIQYHPTTLAIPGKRLLVSEAARGEGGRLYVERDGRPWYFMEEKYPELGNLMPRDVVSREEYFVMHDPACGDQVYLDCTGLSAEIWKKRLPDLRREVLYYTGLDAAKQPVPIEPGIHYFMGGIDTDARHRTNVQGLYAAGECCSLYHGANRLGGNSTLGAVYGGERSAETIREELTPYRETLACIEAAKREKGLAADVKEDADRQAHLAPAAENGSGAEAAQNSGREPGTAGTDAYFEPCPAADEALGRLLFEALGVVREEGAMQAALQELQQELRQTDNPRERARMRLGEAILQSAIFRKESRGAQYRSDYPSRDPALQGMVVASYTPAGVRRTEADPAGNDIQLYLRPQNGVEEKRQ